MRLANYYRPFRHDRRGLPNPGECRWPHNLHRADGCGPILRACRIGRVGGRIRSTNRPTGLEILLPQPFGSTLQAHILRYAERRHNTHNTSRQRIGLFAAVLIATHDLHCKRTSRLKRTLQDHHTLDISLDSPPHERSLLPFLLLLPLRATHHGPSRCGLRGIARSLRWKTRYGDRKLGRSPDHRLTHARRLALVRRAGQSETDKQFRSASWHPSPCLQCPRNHNADRHPVHHCVRRSRSR